MPGFKNVYCVLPGGACRSFVKKYLLWVITHLGELVKVQVFQINHAIYKWWHNTGCNKARQNGNIVIEQYRVEKDNNGAKWNEMI